MELKASMNKARSEYTLPSNHKVVVTFPWLLGFIEGDGSFSFNKLVPRLSIQLTLIYKPVLIAINEFFGGIGSLTTISSSSQKGRESHAPEVSLDFADWTICVRVYFSGPHTLQEGQYLIALLRSRMNNNRLSTNPGNKQNLVISQEKIDDVFNLPAPYEVRNGIRYISDTDILVSESFPVFVTHPDGTILSYPSLSKCALALGFSRKPVREYLDTGSPYKNYFFTSTHPSFNKDQT